MAADAPGGRAGRRTAFRLAHGRLGAKGRWTALKAFVTLSLSSGGPGRQHIDGAYRLPAALMAIGHQGI